jgi:hypothetical protein
VPGVSDVRIAIPDGCRGHLATASFRYYGLTVNHVQITHYPPHGDRILISLPHRQVYKGFRWVDEEPPILQPSRRLEAEIKTEILRAYKEALHD